jgi:hypothetical protein
VFSISSDINLAISFHCPPYARLSPWELLTLRNKLISFSLSCKPHAQLKLEDHPLSAVRGCVFNTFAATLHIRSLSLAVERRKSSYLFRKSNPGCPAYGQLLYWLKYPETKIETISLSSFVFGWACVQISDRRPVILSDTFRGFHQSLQENAGIVPQIKP